MTYGLHLDYERGKPNPLDICVRYDRTSRGWCIYNFGWIAVGTWPCVDFEHCHMPPMCTPVSVLKLAGELIDNARRY